jgi:hypothetical protein
MKMCIICKTKNIKDIVHLTTIECSYCRLLQSIPKELVNLKNLDCSGCKLLQNIPTELVNLKELSLYKCPLILNILKELVNLVKLECSYCPWLNHYSNPEYSDYPKNINNLIMLQKWFRGCLMSKKLKRMYKPILEIYLHPEYKGGYLHKRDMLGFLGSV